MKPFKYNKTEKIHDFWLSELEHVKQAKGFILDSLIPSLVSSVHYHNDLNSCFEYGKSREAKHYRISLYCHNNDVRAIILNGTIWAYAYILVPIPNEIDFCDSSIIRDYETKYLMFFVNLCIPHSDDYYIDGLKRALLNVIEHLIKMRKKDRVNQMIWNNLAVERDHFVELECLFDECHEMAPSDTYYTMMWELYIIGKHYL